MRNLALCLLIVLALAGCARLPKAIDTPITQTQVYQLGNAYGVVQSAAVTYASLPVCQPPGDLGVVTPDYLCRTKAVTKLLSQYDAAFMTAYDRLTAFVRNPDNYPGLSYAQLYGAARSALATFDAAVKAYNLGAPQ